MKQFIIICLLPFLLGACAGLDNTSALSFLSEVNAKGMEIQDKTFDAAAKAIDTYCLSVPEPVRVYVRAQVNSRTEHGDIEFCVGGS